jgi:hypothetical protein
MSDGWKDMPDLSKLEANMKCVSYHLDRPERKCSVTGKTPLSKQLHLIMESDNVEWKNQNIWIGLSVTKGSSMEQVATKLVSLGILEQERVDDILALDRTDDEKCEALAEYMGEAVKESGKMIVYKKQTVGKKQKPNWFPLRVA